MKKYKVLKKYNRYDAGEIVELSDVDASNMFRRGVIEEVKPVKVKEEKKEVVNKSEKKKLKTK